MHGYILTGQWNIFPNRLQGIISNLTWNTYPYFNFDKIYSYGPVALLYMPTNILNNT